jgi:hypothetical protein
VVGKNNLDFVKDSLPETLVIHGFACRVFNCFWERIDKDFKKIKRMNYKRL